MKGTGRGEKGVVMQVIAENENGKACMEMVCGSSGTNHDLSLSQINGTEPRFAKAL